MIYSTFKTLRYIFEAPLNKNNTIFSLKRYLFWQIGSRLVPGDVIVPFVDETVLRTSFGIPGATLNIYCGLHEFEDMAFTLHLLRKGDLFVDVGANIGSYSILAGGAAKSDCISIEPVLDTFNKLLGNINLNKISCTCINMGIGKEVGKLKITTNQDATNHILADAEQQLEAIEIPMTTLNALLSEYNPTLIKIDVEGYETNVILGADIILQRKSLLAIIIELQGSGSHYQFDENELRKKILSYGFHEYRYLPFERQIIPLNQKIRSKGNILFIRNIDLVQNRLKQANKFFINSTKTYI